MSNELLWVLFLIFDFSVALTLIHFLGKRALYAIVIVQIIICNLQVLKLIDLMGMVESFGNISYGSIFLATDLMGEVYGEKEARRAVWLGLFSLVFLTVSMQVTLFLTPHPDDTGHDAMVTLFSLSPRIIMGSTIAFIVSQFHDVKSFHFWKNKTNGKHLWIRNNLSTMTSQFIDTVLFVFIAFYGVYSQETFISIFVTTLIFKWLVAIFDTPIVYLGRFLLLKHEKRQPHEDS